MRGRRHINLMLASLALGVLTSYLVVIVIGSTSRVFLDTSPTSPLPLSELWAVPSPQASPAGPAELREYWMCHTLRGFGRRVDVGEHTRGNLHIDAGGHAERTAFRAREGRLRSTAYEPVIVLNTRPPVLDAVDLIAPQTAPGGGAWLEMTMVSSAGWPLLCTKGWLIHSTSGDQILGLWRPRSEFRPTYSDWIPLVPLPLGLAVNSALFAVPWLTLLFAMRALRLRRRRSRRGHCPTCGYNLAGLNRDVGGVCPECGKAKTV